MTTGGITDPTPQRGIPIVGAGYIATILSPRDFHARWHRSRFRITFQRRAAGIFHFRLRSDVAHKGHRFSAIEIQPRNFSGDLESQDDDNTVLCRLVGAAAPSEWLIAVLTHEPDTAQDHSSNVAP
jgi:hypothetical protein